MSLEKYLKYKNKYLNLKNQIGGNQYNNYVDLDITMSFTRDKTKDIHPFKNSFKLTRKGENVEDTDNFFLVDEHYKIKTGRSSNIFPLNYRSLNFNLIIINEKNEEKEVIIYGLNGSCEGNPTKTKENQDYDGCIITVKIP